MNWIEKFEEEDKRKADAERRLKEDQERRSVDQMTRFEVARRRLSPVLADQVAQVQQRLGVCLNLADGQESIKVSAPRPPRSILGSPYPHWFQVSDWDGDSIQLRVVDDQRINRAGEPPEGMSYGDYYGTEMALVNVRAGIDDLLSGDIERLMAWLVACYRGEDGTKYLDLSCVQKQRNQRHAAAQEKSNNSLAAGVLAFLGIVSLFFKPLGLVARIGGLFVRSRLAESGQEEGRKAAAWAIGLGAIASFLLALSIVATAYHP